MATRRDDDLMKKATAIILCLLLTLCFGVTAMAAGTDDGTVKVSERNGIKFFGTELGENVVKYLAANGSEKVFYDLTDDRDMNVCDLVALIKNQTDLDEDGAYTSADGALLRGMLIK